MTKVTFSTVEHPLVSIVMVTYGGFEWVMKALEAVADHTDPCYEVLVVDNASPDATGPRLRDAVAGARIVLNQTNVGFGAGANQGALLAVGRHLFFVNSDAFVQPGWLPPLLAQVDADRSVGAVVSRLVEPDGTLQEAGGLVGSNGYAGQLGMGADAASPQFRFRRQVDFGSAAALLVRRSAFLAVGGFHPAFVEGYFEDVDLCLDLARHGLRTIYEPTSVVRHLRGGSTDPADALRRATASHAVFVHRWSDELDGRPPIAELDVYPHRLYAARDFVASDRFLLLTPGPPDDALAALIQQLAALWPGARITVAATEAPMVDQRLEGLLDLGIEVAVERDWSPWFAARRFHYSVVMIDGAECLDRFGDALGGTQPHAARIQLARFTDGPVDVEMAGVRTADAVVCLTERALDLARTWAGECRGAIHPSALPAPELVDLMAGLGVAPPLTHD